MNLNAINETWALVHKNTILSNTRNRDLIKALKSVNITFENASISWRWKMCKTKMKQMLHRLRVSKILSTKYKTTFGLSRFDRG